MRDSLCILSPAIFKNVFDAYNSSIISNLFDSYKPYVLSTITKNVRTKCIIFIKALKIRLKNFKHNSRENYSKSTKIAITPCKFSKFFRKIISPDPRELFLFLYQLQISSVEKIDAGKEWKLCPPFTISRYATAGPGCKGRKSGHWF